MPFRYKLQKILDFRIRKKEEQEAIVNKARQKLRMAEKKIEQNNEEITQVSMAKRQANYTMMEYYDKYLHHLWDKAEVLEQERKQADDELQVEIKKLIECEQNVKVLEKHKEKQKELYIEEEKKAELKQFSELGVQRHFLRTREEQEEQELIEAMIREQEEENL
jgi:flagellar FliJ protein